MTRMFNIVGGVLVLMPLPASDFIHLRGSRRFAPGTTVAVDEHFFVAEPQVNVMWNLSQGQRLVFGLGYRAVANAALLGDQLDGVSGSVSFQIGGK